MLLITCSEIKESMLKFKVSFSLPMAVTVLSLGILAAQPALADTFQFTWKGNAGYSAKGSFSYDNATSNTIITNANLESLKVTFFDPNHKLLKAYVLVKDGVDTGVDPYLTFSFNPATKSLVGDLDIGEGRQIGSTDYYLHGTIDSILEFRNLDTNVLDSNSGVITVKKEDE